MELELVRFIKEHKDWEQLLGKEPYCVSIVRDTVLGKDLIMFKYSQMDSDFSLRIVKECRGLILDEHSLGVVSCPFFKFMNQGEETADPIDWNTASITEKIDGSLVKVVNIGGSLLVSTSGTIDASKATLCQMIGCDYRSFGDIVADVFSSKGIRPCDFSPGNTYMFELVSPYTRVVVPYSKTEMYFLGYRDNTTLQEHTFNGHKLLEHFPSPRVYSFSSLEDCIQNASELPWNEEGYVVCDGQFHRVKVKSPRWVAVHHMSDNGTCSISVSCCLDAVRKNEIGEILSYFPEFRSQLDDVNQKYRAFISHEEAIWQELNKELDVVNTSRKETAAWIISHFALPAIGFALLDHKVQTVEEWTRQCSIQTLVRLVF